MDEMSLADLVAAAAQATDPQLTSPLKLGKGGVDPLGLRQTNFDLMDRVFPNLNNVARHVRPFVVVAWAWRQAKRIAEAEGLIAVKVEKMRDFVDRIEVIYAWSQFATNPNADLPGSQVLGPLLNAPSWQFAGEDWEKRRDVRRYSTAFTAPVNYGPALRALGWVEAHEEHRDVLVAPEGVYPALDAFEGEIASLLSHPAFSRFGAVEVSAEEVRAWAPLWLLTKPTLTEQKTAMRLVFGNAAPLARQRGGALMRAAATATENATASRVRAAMAGAPTSFEPPPTLSEASQLWRKMQVRQTFRLSMEALLYWCVWVLNGHPRSSANLAALFIDEAGGEPSFSAGDWLEARGAAGLGPVAAMERLETALNGPSRKAVAGAIADTLAFCLSAAPEHGWDNERADRLPLSRASREADARLSEPVGAFVAHVLDAWIFAQHVYWSVGRGLNDARSDGKSILRLKVVLEEGGWTLAPNVANTRPPVPTPDRLETALNLARECQWLESSGGSS